MKTSKCYLNMEIVRRIKFIFPLFFLFFFVISTRGQNTIYSHSFFQNQQENYKNRTYSHDFFETPAIDFSKGINILRVRYHVEKANVKNEFLSISLKTDESNDLYSVARFIPQLNEGEQVFYIPSNFKNAKLVINQPASQSYFIEEILVSTFIGAEGYSENNSIFIDSAYNLQSTFYEVPISPYQQLPLLKQSDSENKSANAVPVSCPSSSIQENEPDCFAGYKDSTNRGCNNDLTMPIAFSQLYDCKGNVCGKSGTYVDGIASRDVDWYLLPGSGAVNVTLKVVADFRVKIYVLSLLSGCTVFLSSTAASAYAGDTAVINYTTDISTSGIALWVAPYTTSGVVCGSKYFLKYSLGSNIITPVSPVPASNPACVSTNLLPMSLVSGYTFYWQGNSCGYSTSNPATNPYPITQNGTYYVKAKNNAIGCWSSCTGTSVSIISNFLNKATASSDSICAGNPVTLNSAGATTYLWTPGNISGSQIIATPTTTTNYTVTGTYGPCTETSTVSVFVNPKPIITTAASSMSICNGESCMLNAASTIAGTNYYWSPLNVTGNTVTISPNTTSNYSVIGTTQKGCSSSENISIEVRPTPILTISSNSPTICKGENTTIQANSNLPATIFSWSPMQISGNEIIVIPDTTTNYTVTGVSSTGCSQIDSIRIHVNPRPLISASTSNPILCSGDSSTLFAESDIAGTTFLWHPGNNTGSIMNIAPVFSTTYTVVGITPEGCSDSAEISIIVNPTPALSGINIPQSVCEGATTNLSIISDLPETILTWEPLGQTGEEITITPTSSVVFTITGLSKEGCINQIELPLSVNPKPVLQIATNDSILCLHESTILHGLSNITGTSFLWMPDNFNVSEIQAAPEVSTFYTLIGITPEGCIDSVSALIVVNENPELSVTDIPAYICEGQSANIFVSSNINETDFVWFPSLQTGQDINLSPNTTSTYTVTGQTQLGCADTVLFDLNVKPKPIISVISDRSEICLHDTCMVTALSSEEFTVYSWLGLTDTGNIIKAYPESNTLYTTIGTTQFGCSDSASVSILVNLLPHIEITATPPEICQGMFSSLTAQSDFSETTFIWPIAGASGSDILVNPQYTSSYSVIGTNTLGCSSSAVFDLVVHPNPEISAIASPANICFGSTSLISFSSNIPETNYYLFPDTTASGSVLVSPSINSTYSIRGVTNFGCADTTQTTVSVLYPPSPNTSIIGPSDVFQGQRSVSFEVPPIPETNNYIWELPSDSVIITSQHSIITDITQPAQSSMIRLRCENTCGQSDTLKKPITIHPAFKFLEIKAFIEGLYIGNKQMHEANNEFFTPNFNDGIADTLTIELHADSTYNLIEKFTGVPIHTNGYIYVPNISAELNYKYYISLVHRNSTPITSALPLDFIWNDSIYYDFSIASEQAYGIQPQTNVEPGVFAMYSGELSHDTYSLMDLEDLSLIEPDIEIGNIGYIITDLDGSGWVDLSDLSLIEKNMIIGPFYQHP